MRGRRRTIGKVIDFTIKYSGKIEWLESMEAQGQDVRALKDRPTVGPYIFYWKAFNQLTTCRHWGDTPGPIPWTAINDYARRYNLSNQDRADLESVIGALDDKYLTAYFNRQKNEVLKRGRESKTSRPNSR